MKVNLIAMMTLGLFTLMGCNGEAVAQTRSFTLESSPKALFISHAIDVEIVPADRNQIVVEVESGHFDVFEYKYTNGELVLRRKNGFENRLKKADIDIKLYVSDLTKLERIEASGASDVEIEGRNDLRLRSVQLSGASDFVAEGTLQNVVLVLSGASDFEFDGSTVNLDIDASGASDIDMRGNITGKLDVDLSGASSMDYKGVVADADIDVSGASSFKGKGAQAKVASLDASGASSIRIKVDKCRSKSASGMSTIKID